MSSDPLRFFYWEFSEPRLSQHPISVFAFGSNLEAAIVNAVRCSRTLRTFFNGDDAAGRLTLDEVSEIIEERLCTTPPAGKFATRDFVLFHAGVLGHACYDERATPSDPEQLLCTCGQPHPVKVGGSVRLGDVECSCGSVWGKDERGWYLKLWRKST